MTALHEKPARRDAPRGADYSIDVLLITRDLSEAEQDVLSAIVGFQSTHSFNPPRSKTSMTTFERLQKRAFQSFRPACQKRADYLDEHYTVHQTSLGRKKKR